jgi:transcriptional regulator with XRE-family HTH domain
MAAKLTGPACRAARGLLNWTHRDLQAHSGVSRPTIMAVENGEGFRADTEARLVAAFDAHGVEITNGNGTGARLRAEAQS